MKQKIFLSSLSAIAIVTTTISFVPSNTYVTEKLNNLQNFRPRNSYNLLTESPSNIKYSFLYRSSAKNYSDLEISSRSADYYSIQIPIDKYVSDVVKPNNGFVDLTGAEVTKALNQVFKVDSGTSDFVYTTIPIGEETNAIFYSNWTKALDHFGLSYDNKTGVPTFKRDDSNGILYGVISVPNWRFSADDDNSIATGDYSKAFVDKIKSNQDIYELNLATSSPVNSGYFLVKMKTTKTSTKLNANYDYETWTPNGSTNTNINTDQRNPLALFNTKTNQDALSNAINYVKTPSNFNIVKTQTTNKDDANKIDVTTNYTLKDNATVELSLDKFGGTFIQDTGLYNDRNYNGHTLGDVPSITQDFYEKIWNSSWNESNNDTNTGLIVNRTKKINRNEFYYVYSLNSNYKLIVENSGVYNDEKGIGQTRKYEAYLVNADDNSKFTINSNVNKIISMFEDRYVTHAENSALTTQFKQNYQTSYTTTETENKPEEKPDNNNNSNGGNSTDPTVKKNNSVSSTTLGLSIGLPLLGAIILGLLCFIIIMRKNQKRLTNGFTKEEVDKSSKGDK